MLVGVGLTLEPDYLNDGQSLRIEGLASDQVVKASSFCHQTVSETALIQPLNGARERLCLHESFGAHVSRWKITAKK